MTLAFSLGLGGCFVALFVSMMLLRMFWWNVKNILIKLLKSLLFLNRCDKNSLPLQVVNCVVQMRIRTLFKHLLKLFSMEYPGYKRSHNADPKRVRNT